jgi:bacterioferritin
MNGQDTKRAVGILNKIMDHELVGIVRYTHNSLMIMAITVSLSCLG